MLNTDVALLGLVAGLTIFLGLPIARIGKASPRLLGILNSVALGILIFLFVEITVHAFEPVEEITLEAAAGDASAADAAVMHIVFAVGLALGLLGLVYFENRYIHGAPKKEDEQNSPEADSARRLRLSLMIAIGIGLHNLSEGLAIGASAGAGEIAFAATLAVGFALHNATEGFGIAGPLAGTKPSWKFLIIAGLIAGGPTFLGTIIGSLFTSEVVSVLFLALASGALIYVIKELLHHGRKTATDPEHSMVVMGAIVLGFLVGFATELSIGLAGG